MEHGHLVCKLTTLLHQQYLQLILQTQLAHSAGWELDIKQWGKCNSDTIQGYPISFNEEPIVLGIHYGGQADVNIISSGSLGNAALANCFFYHSNYNGKVQVNWIAIGL